MPVFGSLRVRTSDRSKGKARAATPLQLLTSLAYTEERTSRTPPPLTPTSSISSGLSSAVSTPESVKTTHSTSLSVEDECEAMEQMEINIEQSRSSKQKRADKKAKAVSAKNDVPTPIQVEKAMQCRVYSEDGRNIEFGHIVRGNYGAPTIVIFVRHMWCGLCQEFLRSLRRVDEKCYKSAGVEVIVVGCGDPSLIRRYKETAKFEGRMFSDPSGELQERLGMTWRTLDPGTDAEKGDYQQMSMLKNGLLSAANGLRMLSGSPGAMDRLGGELVFDIDEVTDEIICTYAHRMINTRSHGPLDKLFGAAGVALSSETDAVLRSLDAEEEGMACPLYP